MGNGVRKNIPLEEEAANEASTFNAMVLDGKIRAAVRRVTQRGKGGILDPLGTNEKSGKPVLQVLRELHPNPKIPDLSDPAVCNFEEYRTVPAVLRLTISADCVGRQALKLHGAAGPGGIDAREAEYWILRCGAASQLLREELAAWAEWMSNGSPPWAAIRAICATRMLPADKEPGVRPISCGEIWYRLMSKCNLEYTKERAKWACGNRQLCAGLESGLEGALHAMREQWPECKGWIDADDAADTENIKTEWEGDGDQPEPEVEEDFTYAQVEPAPVLPMGMKGQGVTLFDARNGFCELQRMGMLWTIRHRWASGSRFCFNAYRHDIIQLVRISGQAPETILSREGVCQGCPHAMFAYGVALLPLAELLNERQPDCLIPFYADDAAAAGRHEQCAITAAGLREFGPHFGYFPEAHKSWHVCKAEEEEAARACFAAQNFNINFTRGKRYLGGFVGSLVEREVWLCPKIDLWVAAIHSLALIARRYPQTAYAGLVISLQAEWQYLCRAVPDVEQYLTLIEEELHSTFLPALFGSKVDQEFRQLLANSVKQGRLGVRDPVVSAPDIFAASQEGCAVLAESMVNDEALDSWSHIKCISTARKKARTTRLEAENGKGTGGAER